MISFEEINNILESNGLKPTSQREMPLYTLSCILFSYTKLLKEILGYSYEVVAAIGGEGKFHSLFNELLISQHTGKYVGEHYKSLNKLIFEPSQKVFEECELKFAQSVGKDIEPLNGLRIINTFYPQYMSRIAIYNCFWRYLGNEATKGRLTEQDVKNISEQRDQFAKFYPKVEKIIKEYSERIGNKENFDGDLLRYLTYFEMSEFLNGKLKITDTILKELSKRREKYFYLYTIDSREELITDKKVIEKIYNKFYLVKEEVKEIKGFSAYKGIVRGKVLNLQKHKMDESFGITEDCVLVASMTHPDDIKMIKSCLAIVTDEGGILSHAAIVAREFKKPCIIGTKIATQVLKDGDFVEVDADLGVVKIINKVQDIK